MNSSAINTSMGSIQINNQVVAGYAGSAAVGCMGVVGLAAANMAEGFQDGWGKLLKKDSITRGIVVSRKGTHVSLELHVILAYGLNIPAIGRNLRESVYYAVSEHTGLKVDNITIYVDGVRVID